MERNIISFSANQQELIKTGGISHYASNVVGYIVAEFDLGENWTEFDSVRAVFKSDYETVPAVLSHGACVIPFEVLKRRSTVKVNLVGSVAESNVLVDRLTSYPITALVVDANATVDNDIEPITPTEFEQFVAAVKADADRAEAGAESAEAAVEDAEASEQAALGSAQAAAASALNAANSASDASNYADRVAQMVAEVIAEIEEFEGVTVTVETLPAGSQATASFADGVLHLGIPRGDKGEQGDRGERGETGATGATGATGNGIESITLTSTSGAVKTYTILFTDGTSTTFEVTDGEVTQAVLDETVSDLKADIGDIKTDTNVELGYATTTSEYGIRTTAVGSTVSPYSTSAMSYRTYDVNEGDMLKVQTAVTASTNYQYSGYFTDDNGVVISQILPKGADPEMVAEIVVVPTGATKLYMNYMNKKIGVYGEMYVRIAERLPLQSQINDVATEIEDNFVFRNYIQYATSVSEYAYRTRNIGDSIGSPYNSTAYAYRTYSVHGGDLLEVQTYVTTSEDYRYQGYFVDENGIVVGRFMIIGASSELRKEQVVVPDDAVTLYLNYYHKNIGDRGAMQVAVLQPVSLESYGENDRMMAIGNQLLDDARAKVFDYNASNLCLNFPFITDIHVNGYGGTNTRAKYNVELFKTIANERWSAFAFCGGDLVTVTADTTRDEYLDSAAEAMQVFGEIEIPTFIARGNHDCNGKGSSDEAITSYQWYLLTQQNTDSDVQYDSSNSGWFYHDYDDKKIRVIVLSAYTGMESGALYGDQMTWFGNVALNFSDKETPSDWHTLVLVHSVSSNTRTPFWRILTAFKNGADDHDDDVDFTSQGTMTVIGIIHGHTHADEYLNVNDINVIGSVAGYGDESNLGTALEYGIDIFSIDTVNTTIYASRIGRGSDRSFSYGDSVGQIS